MSAPTGGGACDDGEVTPQVLTAPAKLTVSLRITGVRGDGYHLIDAEMVTIDLADEVHIEPGGEGIEVVPTETGLSVSAGPDNSIARALALVGPRAGVRLVKHIPAGAGLGGASADAAAILRWADIDDPVRAAAIGADVPFCVRGGRARVSGIGEVLTPLPFEEATFTLVIPPFGCSTPAVYAAWDALGGPHSDGTNDLEPAALQVEPRLARWRDGLANATGARPVLAGSGSTWFVPGAHPGDGQVVVHTIPPLVD